MQTAETKNSMCIYIDSSKMVCTTRKCVFGHMRTAKAQISLRIHTVWSGPSLSANRIIGHYKMYEWRAKAWMILCTCAVLSESAYSAHVQRHIFSRCGPYILQYQRYCKWTTKDLLTFQNWAFIACIWYVGSSFFFLFFFFGIAQHIIIMEMSWWADANDIILVFMVN